MNFLKVAARDISNIFKNRFIRVSVIAIIIVPLLYSLLYLAAFWDPYSKLQSLPVAVVNLDKGTTQDGKAVNYGKDIVNNLKKDDELGWHFVSLQDAENGVKGNKYYGMFVIPGDFSQNAASAENGTPKKASILFQENEKKNFLAAQINGKVVLELKQKIANSITDEYTKVTFDNLYDLKNGIIQAADGSGQLKDGAAALRDGSNSLKNGIAALGSNLPELKDGGARLYSGAAQLDGGLTQTESGIAALYNGANSLTSGIAGARGGANQVSSGLDSINSQIPGMASGIAGLYTGSETLNAGINAAEDGAGQLNSGIKAYIDTAVNPVSSGINGLDASLNQQILPGMKQLSDGSAQVADGVNSLISSMTNSQNQLDNAVQTQLMAYLAKHPEAMSDPDMQAFLNTLNTMDAQASDPSNQQQISALENGAQQLKDSSAQLYSGMNGDFKNGLDNLSSGMPQFTKGANQLYDGSSSLMDGLNQASAGSSGLMEGLRQLNSQIPALQNGIAALDSGSRNLSEGIGQIYGGSNELKNSIASPDEIKNVSVSSSSNNETLFDGISQLKSGSSQLMDGTLTYNNSLPALLEGVNRLQSGANQLYGGAVNLADGAAQLNSSLRDGAGKLTGSLKNSSTDMAKFVSDPITVNEKPIDAVKDYGTGFTPYFIPLSLWVGALMMFFIITDKVDKDIKAGSASVVVGKFLSYGYIGILQAILVSVVVLLLGLKPGNLPLYFITNIVMSFVFIAIMQCLIFLLGQAGRLLSIVLLILQLTSSGGTFPMELVPGFFKAIHPFMPFTYGTSALREAISGVDYSVYGRDMIILMAIMIVFLTVSVLLKEHADRLHDRIKAKGDFTGMEI